MKLISITEAAAAAEIPRPTIKRWCANGRIKGACKVGRQWAIPQNWTPPQLQRGRPHKQAQEQKK